MPSDVRTTDALRFIGPGIAAFQSAAAAAAERLESYGAATPDDPSQAQAAVELGEFAADRIDMERFAALQDERRPLDPFQRARLHRARAVLRDVATLPASSFTVDVPTGGRLADILGSTFAELGRAFGALLVAELARAARYEEGEHSSLLHGLPRHRWSRAERLMSPPLVVTIDGADLWAGEIAQYLDGNQKLVLVVRSPCPPAPLVRLITPHTLVMQTSSTDLLTTAMETDGPAVAAFVPDGAAEFIHSPGSQRAIHERLRVSVTPHGARKSLQSWSLWQQQEELQQLIALSTPPVAVVLAEPTGNGARPTVDPADRLAAWLLSQAGTTSSPQSPVIAREKGP